MTPLQLLQGLVVFLLYRVAHLKVLRLGTIFMHLFITMLLRLPDLNLAAGVCCICGGHSPEFPVHI